MRSALILVVSVVVLAVLNWLVWKKEQTLTSVKTVLLDLAPRDPRSIMQGDYMVLRYKLAQEVKEAELSDKGRVVIKLDERSIGHFARLDDGSPIASDECLLIYRRRDGLRLGAESFFFQEGDAALYEQAKFGEMKVDGKGNSVLVGLRDEKLLPLGAPVVK